MPEDLQAKVEGFMQLVTSKAMDPDGGVTRLLYSKEWVETQKVLKKIMEQEGMTTHFDDIGNLYGRVSGTEKPDETILTGSHMDSVKNGGRYDGMYGIIAGIVAIGHLVRQYGLPKKNIEVVAFAEEEGSRFDTTFWGSKNFLGLEQPESVKTLSDDSGQNFVEAMHEAGFDFKRKTGFQREDVQAFIEAHVEQGNVLETEKKEIGIVDSIVGQYRFNIQVYGTANHAGTTPMSYRRDSLYAAVRMINGILDRAKNCGAPLVATVGHISVKPDMSNIVPGETEFSLDVRHTNEEFLDSFVEEIKDFMEKTAAECNVKIKIDTWMRESPVLMDKNLVSYLYDVCQNKKISSKIMHSGAGHDSQIIAQKIPTAMIFVPSKDGISHNPREYTDPQQMVRGIEVLEEAIHGLAY